jgi:DNA-binding response OmpR family regulator
MNTDTKTVLIVEDEADLREAVTTALTYEGFTVLSAQDGEAGLATALEKKPNLILLDITMPKMDGLEVLMALRADEWGKGVQVIVMTASDDLGKVAEVVEAGGNEYIVKTDISLAGIVLKVKEKLGK